MLRRSVVRATAAPSGASVAQAASQSSIFLVSRFWRPTDTPVPTTEEFVAAGRATGRDVAAASFRDFLDLQTSLIVYRGRRLHDEIKDLRSRGILGALPGPLNAIYYILQLFVVYYLTKFGVTWRFGPLDVPPTAPAQ